MRCQECGIEAEGDAKGWEAYLVDLDDDGQEDVIFFCPACAAREFHCVEPPHGDWASPSQQL